MKHLFLLFLLIVLMVSTSSAQSGIHTREQRLPCLKKEFNVYVHVAVDSITRQPIIDPAMVDSILEKTTAFFEPICLSFIACETNIIENYTFANLVNLTRIAEMNTLFAKPSRINIFILESMPSFCGYSTTYGIHSKFGNSIFIERNGKECNETLEGQLAHHLGHFFGLQDTYHGSEIELVDDPDCAIRADSICDTPTDPFGAYSDSLQLYIDVDPRAIQQTDFIIDCKFIHEMTDPNGRYYQPQVGNIMSAYPCKCGFTNQQFQKIASNYNRSNHKPY